MPAIVSLGDIGDVPSKPDIPGGGTMGVVATWSAVPEYVGLLSEGCLVPGSEVECTLYGEQAASPNLPALSRE